jgi:tripartite-type tricarboxylate transporter receptor subunit TctC
MGLPRRRTLLGLGALLAPAAARGQDRWPSQPIKLVVPYPPGALTDVLGRMVGERLNMAFGQPVIVGRHAGSHPRTAEW